MGTRPQTMSGLADSPAGPAASLFDHGNDYAQPTAAISSAVLGCTIDGRSAGDLFGLLPARTTGFSLSRFR
jgi:hypothetical protein